MRGTGFRPQPWLVSALLALIWVGGCDLNPQPLPPESNGGAAASSDAGALNPSGPMTLSDSGAMNSSSGGGFGRIRLPYLFGGQQLFGGQFFGGQLRILFGRRRGCRRTGHAAGWRRGGRRRRRGRSPERQRLRRRRRAGWRIHRRRRLRSLVGLLRGPPRPVLDLPVADELPRLHRGSVRLRVRREGRRRGAVTRCGLVRRHDG